MINVLGHKSTHAAGGHVGKRGIGTRVLGNDTNERKEENEKSHNGKGCKKKRKKSIDLTVGGLKMRKKIRKGFVRKSLTKAAYEHITEATGKKARI